VDGVYAARAQGALALMYDLENVQVLRGPQGTLFGRNNTGGALLLQARKPAGEVEGDVQLTYGSNNRQQVSGGVSVPITDTLGVRIAGYLDKDDGWVDALSEDPRGVNHNYSGIAGRTPNTGVKLNNTNVRSARITTLWEPTDRLSWTAQYETFSDRANGGILLNPVEVEAGKYEAFIDSPISLDLTSDVFRSIVSYDINDFVNVEYIAGSADLHRDQIVDQDAGVTSRFQEARTEYQDTVSNSHELKFQSTGDGPLSWTAGLYYFEEETEIRFDFDGQGAWLQGGATFIQPARGAESSAVYGQASYAVKEGLTLTGGVRYTDDLKYDRGGRNVLDCNSEFITPTLGGSDLTVFEDFLDNRTGEEGADGLDDLRGVERARGQCAATTRNDIESETSEVTYLLRGSYEWDESMLYASVGTGYRAGEIQDGGKVTNPEESVSYEVGYKLDAGAVRFNAAGFFVDYTDLIRAGFDEDLNQIVTSNVAGAEIKGLEVEMTWLVGDNGVFNFGGGYLDAEYTDYIVDGAGFGTNVPAILDENGEPTGFYSLVGNTMPQSPKFSFNSSLQWDFEIAAGIITPRINVRYVDEVFFRDHNENGAEINNLVDDVVQTGYYSGNPAGQDAYTKVNVGVTFVPSDQDWLVDLFVNNATDEMTKSSASVDNNTSGGFPGRYASPRTWGMRFSSSF